LRAHEISSWRAKYRHFSRYVVKPPNAGSEATSLSEKIYSFFLKGLAKASVDNHNHGQAIALQAPDGLQAEGFCWEEKSIHEVTRRGLRVEGR